MIQTTRALIAYTLISSAAALSFAPGFCQSQSSQAPTVWQRSTVPQTSTQQTATAQQTITQQTSTNTEGTHHRKAKNKPIKVAADAPLWERYLAYGSQFRIKGDLDKAKQYFLASLDQLEKVPPKSHVLSPHIVQLEHSLMQMYPKYPKQGPRGQGPNEIKLDEEEIAVLDRIRRLDRIYPSTNYLYSYVAMTQERYVTEDLNKNKEAEQNTSQPHKQ
jgi:hypothetical protein